MARSFGSLGDFFPETDIRCRIRGCNNVWRFSGEDALHNVAKGKPARPERMCDDCFAEFQKLEDREVPCSREGCGGVWIWNRFQQLEAMRQGRDGPPKRLCKACLDEQKKIADQEIPCRNRACKNTWTWRARDQILSEDGKPPRRYCDACFQRLRQLRPIAVPCRIRGCGRTWEWSPYQQLEHLAAGKDLEHPPRLMCRECYDAFQQLEAREEPCRIRECGNTWTYTAYEQLERKRSLEQADAGDKPEVPERMCRACYEFYSKSVDREIPCRNRGCPNTWLYTRAMQLRRWKQGKKGDPHPMCAACREKLEQLEDRQIECMVPGCSGTWTWTAVEQLKDSLIGKNEPAPRRCDDCEKFLARHQAETLRCVDCGREIRWSAYEQLLSALGTFVKPVRCTDCAGQALALQRPPERIRPEHHHVVVRIPPAGRWHEDDRIRDWPPHMTHDVIERVEKADIRIVAIGDDLTWSGENEEETWPYLLEQRLNEHGGGTGPVAVVNAGIPRCTTHQGVLRFARDVVPFQPDLVLFSFVFGDSRIFGSGEGGQWRHNADPGGIEDELELFVQKIAGLSGRALYWTTNPIFPHESERAGRPGAAGRDWAKAQEASFRHCLRQARLVCARHAVPTLDLRSKFEVNGLRSAHKWMANWYMPNPIGAANIAVWFADFLIREGFLPAAEKSAKENSPAGQKN